MNVKTKNITVLVVDDDYSMRLLARKTLEASGFIVEEQSNGEDGLKAFQSACPDIVLLDVVMPKKDGFETCYEIRNLPMGKQIPILMMTSLNDIKSIERAYQMGATDFITKPINYTLLGHRVFYMLRSKQLFDDLQLSEKKLSHALQLAKLGQWELDINSGFIDFSKTAARLFNIIKTSLPENTEELLALIHPDDRNTFKLNLDRAIESRKGLGFEHRGNTHNGSEKTYYQQLECIRDEQENKLKLVATVQDITARKQTERKIFKLSHYDELTGLPNRTFFNEYVNNILEQAKRHGKYFSILTVDLDNFKRINDTYGLSTGDELLKLVAGRLLKSIRQGDCVTRELRIQHITQEPVSLARSDGDTFYLVLTEIQKLENVASVSERLQKLFLEPFNIGGDNLYMSASIGISVYPNDGENAETLIKNANSALHFAKENGKNCYCYYTKNLQERASERLSLENHLHTAVEENHFNLYYQPKIHILKKEIVGFEALLRWDDPKLGQVPPMKFIPIAEDNGLIIPISEWILTEVCSQALSWQTAQVENFHIAVNISAHHFKSGSLIESVKRALAETNLNPTYLQLEVTEGTLMEDVASSTSILNKLKRMGVSIALDDFGTGYSSLNYLKRFPIDVLKIDKSFISELEEDPNNKAIIGAIIDLAENLQLNVIAEGVETQQQLSFLLSHHCYEIQGYYFSKPLCAKDIEKFISEKNYKEKCESIEPIFDKNLSSLLETSSSKKRIVNDKYN